MGVKHSKDSPARLAAKKRWASAESFFRTRTTTEYRNESLPDLCGSSEDIPSSPIIGHAVFKRIFTSNNSSLERVDTERRGSLPLVSTYNESMESVSTTSKLAHFFSKKGFKSNLKRTKSATKLDRKRSSPNLSDNDSSSLMGSLRRTMSLGRLSRKKGKSGRDFGKDPSKTPTSSSSTPSRQPTPHASPALSLISARIRSSRSHESLLASPPSMHSFDLRDPDVEVKPLHSSVLGQGQCFRVATSQGSKYISCTTSEERDKWLSSLRRVTRPHEEHSRRSDNSLKLWVVEAKNVAAKKRYFCEILLDGTVYAKTSVKTMTEMLFWGEHFEFKNLPLVDIITVNLFREADKKKKKDKDTLVGYINLSLSEIENRQLFEKWLTCRSGTVGKAGKETKSELPIIRLKARRQTVNILPLDAYQSFIQYLTSDYKQLCQMFEPLLAVREKEDFATSLVHILQKQSKACEFLSDIVMEEISRLDDEHLTFRGNSIATKAMEAYMKLVGEKYLKDTLGDFISQMIQSTDDCEVDPTKVSTPQLLVCQQKNLDMYSNMAWVKVINSFCYFPNEMREVFSSLRSRCSDRGKVDYSDNLISGCIFLRFLCPAILYPSLFNLTQEYPNERASRNLTLIAKTIQTLANFTQFGGKEEFMTFMNTFVEREAPQMKSFLHKISSQEVSNQFLQFDGYIDLGKELSVLHCLLLECMEKYSETSGKPFEELSKILNSLSNAQDDPTVGQKKPNRKSQIYDNLVHIPSPAKEAPQTGVKIPYTKPKPKNALATSPTEVLIDMLRHCGESTEDIPALANRGKPPRDNTKPGEAPSPQPLAFANPLFRHQQQQARTGGATRGGGGGATSATHHGMTLSQAETVRRVSSDSSLSSEDGGAESQHQQTTFVKTMSSTTSDYHSSIAPLKMLSQLSSSSSDDSLNGKSASSANIVTSLGQSSSNFVHSTSANFSSPQSSSKMSPAMSSLSNSAMNGCSTFPRRYHRQQDQTSSSNDISPPLPPREAVGSLEPATGSLSSKGPAYHRQFSSPVSNVPSARQPSRPYQNRAGLTTTPTGHVQQRNVGGKIPPVPIGSNVDSNKSQGQTGLQSSSSSPAVAPRSGNKTGHSMTQTGFTSPASHHRPDGGHLASPAVYRSNNNGSSTNINSTTVTSNSNSVSSRTQMVSHRPPVSSGTTMSTGWQIAQHVERSGSSQETSSSSSSDSSPQSLVRSTQHNTSSMHESSSAHSISSAPSSSQPWGYTPSHSDSNSSISSLTKLNPRAPVRSDSSGSLGGLNISRISQTPSDSNSSMSSGNNNTGGLSNTSNPNQLDNLGHYINHPNPNAFNTRLSSISDSQIHTSSLQTNPLPQPPAFLTSKYSVVHPSSPRTERSASYHSATDSVSSSSSSRSAYTVSRSMDLGYLSKQRGEPLKRASTDSTLSQPPGSLSPTGPGPSRPLSREDSSQSVSSSANNTANRRLSPQSTVHMGISSVQRKLQEQERTKQEYEQEVHVLRQQLLEAQERLAQAEMRLLDHEVDTHKLMDEWQYRLVESEEKMRRQQAEKDEQMKTIITRLQTIEEDLKREQAEMASAVEHKQQVIEVQEQRIKNLDKANNKLIQALADLKARAAKAAALENRDENSNSATSALCNGVTVTKEIAGFKTSSC